MKSEYHVGFVNGLRHGEPIVGITPEAAQVLYAENAEKAKRHFAMEGAVREYWKGYLEGMRSEVTDVA
jgi:hypothetical protein